MVLGSYQFFLKKKKSFRARLGYGQVAYLLKMLTFILLSTFNFVLNILDLFNDTHCEGLLGQ